MLRPFPLLAALLGAIALASPASAYPVSGAWTYDNATAAGPAKQCGRRVMRFEGMMRHDTETAAPDYRNLSLTTVNATTWRAVDQFYTGVVWGKVYYTLRLLDPDHISIHLDKGGKLNAGGAQWVLRRCL
jgi:hypothetical protein